MLNIQLNFNVFIYSLMSQADLVDVYRITKVATQGRGEMAYSQWPTTYKIAKYDRVSGVVEFYMDPITCTDKVK